MPRGRKAGASTKSRAKRRTRAQVDAILSEISSLTGAGSTLTAALKKLGVSYSNYNYWKKRQGGKAIKPDRRAGGPRKSGVIGLLQAMTNNRAQREQLEKQLQQLDARFNELKRELERG